MSTNADIFPDPVGSAPVFDQGDYQELRQRYLEPRHLHGENAELPEGMRLRGRKRPARIDTDTPGFRALKERIKSLGSKHAQIYELLKKLRHWEIHNTAFPSVSNGDGSNDDAVKEVVDLTDLDNDTIIDVDSYIVEVLLVAVVKPDPDAVPEQTATMKSEPVRIKTEPGMHDAVSSKQEESVKSIIAAADTHERARWRDRLINAKCTWGDLPEPMQKDADFAMSLVTEMSKSKSSMREIIEDMLKQQEFCSNKDFMVQVMEATRDCMLFLHVAPTLECGFGLQLLAFSKNTIQVRDLLKELKLMGVKKW